MFADQRDYRAILFTSRDVPNLGALRKILPRSRFEPEAELQSETERFSALHAFYYSTTRFVQDPETLDQITVARSGKNYYRYDMYGCSYETGPTTLILMAVPFARMGIELLGGGHRDVAIGFRTVNLRRLIEKIRTMRHLGGRVKVRVLEMAVTGDPAFDRFSVAGSDALHAQSFDKLTEALQGLELTPRSCVVTYDDHEGSRFTTQVDRFGNFAFRMASEARNLPKFQPLLEYFIGEKLLETTNLIPFKREL